MKFKPKFFATVRLYFRTKYLAWFEKATLKLLAKANLKVRKLLILQGKNPDYVPPPPTPPPSLKEYKPFDSEAAARRIAKAYDFVRESGNGGNNWVKYPGKHPVLQARLAYENKLANPLPIEVDQPLQVAASTAKEDLDAFTTFDKVDLTAFETPESAREFEREFLKTVKQD